MKTMPISCPIKFRVLSEDDFHQLDYRVMRHVFDAHNELGRLHDESVYQRDLAARLVAAGLGPVQTEVPLTVRWREYRKDYHLDLVIQDCLLHELKTATSLAGEHKTQLLNYILLLGLHTGKLINFRPPQVESWFASTTLTLAERALISTDTSRWRSHSARDGEFQTAVTELLQEVGAYLDLSLYEDLLTQFLGGEQQVVQSVEIVRNGTVLGRQRCRLLAPDIAFRITAHGDERDQVEPHLRRWLAHTGLRALQWINLNRTRAEFITLNQ